MQYSLGHPLEIFEARYRDDDRCRAILAGLAQLQDCDLLRLQNHVAQNKPLVLDEYNYNPHIQSWCPLAVALGMPNIVTCRQRDELTNAAAKKLIISVGRQTNSEFTLNPVRRFRGHFFTWQRRRDLRIALAWTIARRDIASR